MKTLTLNEILPSICGEVINKKSSSGIRNFFSKLIRTLLRSKEPEITINRVVTTYKYLKDNTMVFDFQEIPTEELIKVNQYKGLVIVTKNPEKFLPFDVKVVKVNNLVKAYWGFVSFYRELVRIPIVGITGTCGKTTTKEMLMHILRGSLNVTGTYGSINGLQKNLHYLLEIDDKVDAAVIEMGVAYPDDILNYLKYFNSQIRVMLNIGVHHLKGCITPKAYFEYKAQMLNGLDTDNGVLILNADDEKIAQLNVSHLKNVIYFGATNPADFAAKEIKRYGRGMAFKLIHDNETFDVYLPGYGKHNVYNALAAIAAAKNIGISVRESIARLKTFKQVTSHLEVMEGIKGSVIIDDTWNNSPMSMLGALDELYDLAGENKKIALLGRMPQMSEDQYAKEEYKKIARKVLDKKIDMLVVVGEEANDIGLQAIELGMDSNKVYFSEDGEEILSIISPYIETGTTILLKITHRDMVTDSFVTLRKAITK